MKKSLRIVDYWIVRFLVLLVLIIASAGESPAATHICGTPGVANSCTPSGLTSLIGNASDGDTVVVAPGVHNFTSGTPVVINKRITITGGGSCAGCGTNSPAWSGNVQLNTGTSNAFRVDVRSPGTGIVRITGMHFVGAPGFTYHWWDGDGSALPSGFFSAFSSNQAYYRIDNNRFDSTTAHNGGFLNTPGVVDKNIFESDQIEGHMLFVQDYRTDGNGDAAWAEPTVYGGGLVNRWVFIEANTFIRPAGQVIFESSVVDTYAGGRYVFRNNYVRNGWILNHDKSGGGNTRSGVAFEVYGNTFNFESQVGFQSAMYLRDGSMLYYNNNHVGYWQAFVKFWNRRINEAQGNWGVCDGLQPWDKNIGPGGRLCADQVGTGRANGMGRLNTQPQAALPVRIWNNSGVATGGCAGAGQHNNKICNTGATTIIDGTDYIFSDDGSAAPSGYSAYPYPHPLTVGGGGGDPNPPAAPTGLTIN